MKEHNIKTDYIKKWKSNALKEYISKVDAIEKLYRKIADLENLIEAFDKDIEELEGTGLDGTVEILCKARNSLNLEKLDLEIHICKLKLWLAEFEKARQLAR